MFTKIKVSIVFLIASRLESALYAASVAVGEDKHSKVLTKTAKAVKCFDRLVEVYKNTEGEVRASAFRCIGAVEAWRFHVDRTEEQRIADSVQLVTKGVISTGRR